MNSTPEQIYKPETIDVEAPPWSSGALAAQSAHLNLHPAAACFRSVHNKGNIKPSQGSSIRPVANLQTRNPPTNNHKTLRLTTCSSKAIRAAHHDTCRLPTCSPEPFNRQP